MSTPARFVSTRRGRKRRRITSVPLQNEAFRGLVTCSVPKTILSFFPDTFRAWGQTANVQDHAATTGISLQYQLNNSVNLFGPRANYAGAFAANVPSGLVYLISSNGIAGAAAPYAYVVIERAEVEITIQSSLNTNTVGTNLSILFNSQLDSTGGMPITQIEEQPLSAHKQIPALTGTPVSLKSSINLWDALGVSEQTYVNNPQDYGASVGVAPVTTVYCSVLTRALDGVTVSSYSLMLRFRMLYRFTKRNNYSTAVPA
jgi:hypothetical protein